MEETTARVAGREICLLGVCQGLAGEAEDACSVIETQRPDVVALALEPDLAPNFDELSTNNGGLDSRDQAYKDGLSEWGEVRLPSPAYREAITTAKTVGARVEGVDLPESEYMDQYLDSIGVLELAKRALQLRWMALRPPTADDPAAYCRAFDERLNVGPFADLQQRREQVMADNLAHLAEDETVTYLVEVERLDGVTRALETAAGRDR